MKYQLKILEDSQSEQGLCIIETETLNEFGSCRSLPQGLDLIKSIIDTADKKASEPEIICEEYSSIMTCLQEIIIFFTYSSPMFLQEEFAEKEDTPEKITETLKNIYGIQSILARRLKWYEQEIIRPFLLVINDEHSAKAYIFATKNDLVYLNNQADLDRLLKNFLDRKKINEEDFARVHKEGLDFFHKNNLN